MHPDFELNLSAFLSNQHCSRLLQNSYEKRNIEFATEHALKNVENFTSHISIGKSYIDLADKSPIEVKPILAFYGLVNLLKACAIKYDPYYPSDATLLAHGVSTRKRKKTFYEFMKDEVKVQKNGFFPYISDVAFICEIKIFQKFSMFELFCSLPELDYLFNFYGINKRPVDFQIHELLVHYLILYNLSMIARYEVCWWSKLIRDRKTLDYPLIDGYLRIFFANCEHLIVKELCL